MQPRVTAILVARNGAEFLPRTLASLSRQLRRPDSLVVVDDASTDATSALLAEASPTQLVRSDTPRSFGVALAHALRVAVPEDSGDEWLWLLGHDTAPEPGALRALVSAVEIAPSVAVAGAKLMSWDRPDVIAEYGDTITRLGASVSLVIDELDQAQHDRRSDLLAVASRGMLVRRSVFSALGGFDPALPSIDAAIDFCIRVRLAGHRVIGVPGARVASAGGPESFDRRPSASATARLSRAAQLHRRLTYAPAFAVPLHWLSLLPLAVLRVVWHLLGKRPALIVGEIAAAFAALLDRRVVASRRNLARNRVLGWGAIAPLRMSFTDVRHLRAHQRDVKSRPIFDATVRVRPSFFASGGAWVTLLLAAIGVIAFGSFIGATAVAGGALAPLGSSLALLWSNVGYGMRGIGTGFVGAADPFAAVLAVIGSLAFWSPPGGVVILYLVALPLAGVSAWSCAARFSERGWAPAFAAVTWALAPPFLSSLSAGHLGAAISHLLLPWLVLALVGAARSWSASAAASLFFAIIGASSPVLLPVLLLGWFAWLVAHPTRAHRLMGIPVPAVVLFLPLLIEQGVRGNWLALLADPGVPFVAGTSSGAQLALGSANGGSNGFEGVAMALGLPDAAGTIIAIVLLAPLAIVAMLALYLPGSRRAVPSLVVALVGFALAVASAHLAVVVAGSQPVTIWPGSGLSVFWLGLTGAAVFGLSGMRRRVGLPAVAASLAAIVLAAPGLGGLATGTTAVAPSSGRILPAFVTAESVSSSSVGTLIITPVASGGITASLERGAGTTLDAQSTLAATATEVGQDRLEIATLAGNLASRSGFDAAKALEGLGIGFVIVRADSTDAGALTRARATEALDANPALEAVGSRANMALWHVTAPGLTDSAEADSAPSDSEAADSAAAYSAPRMTNAQEGIAVAVRILFAVVFGAVTLLAIPTSRRRRSRLATASGHPATTFDEVDDDE